MGLVCSFVLCWGAFGGCVPDVIFGCPVASFLAFLPLVCRSAGKSVLCGVCGAVFVRSADPDFQKKSRNPERFEEALAFLGERCGCEIPSSGAERFTLQQPMEIIFFIMKQIKWRGQNLSAPPQRSP